MMMVSRNNSKSLSLAIRYSVLPYTGTSYSLFMQAEGRRSGHEIRVSHTEVQVRVRRWASADQKLHGVAIVFLPTRKPPGVQPPLHTKREQHEHRSLKITAISYTRYMIVPAADTGAEERSIRTFPATNTRIYVRVHTSSSRFTRHFSSGCAAPAQTTPWMQRRHGGGVLFLSNRKGWRVSRLCKFVRLRRRGPPLPTVCSLLPSGKLTHSPLQNLSHTNPKQ